MHPRGPRLPDTIDLAGIGETWHVDYHFEPGASVSTRGCRGRRLVLQGAVHNPTATVASLRRWLARRTRDALGARLHELAGTTGLPAPERMRVGFPRTRWASCSARGTISINARCLFLPARLVRSVLIHELCHLEELNHSPAFHALVDRHDPGHAAARRELRDAGHHIPQWVEAAP